MAISFDGTTPTIGAIGSLHEWNHTVATGIDNLIIVCISIRQGSGGETVLTVKYNGENLAKAGNHQIIPQRTEIWYLFDPIADGAAHTVQVKLTSAGRALLRRET